ncbi:DgyrCDS10453 [Dimorphilus gyrociliatus]|uniref:DgyrCDS10453 n=1 Tax=Dimorphilus gyrociliatus TaxID=2664684 RepID=A0A7I8W086_9ANNE|nr:DgyrCDS10453 [Dimorphilus gyrociliatus]
MTKTQHLYAGDITVIGEIMLQLSNDVHNMPYNQALNLTKAITQSVSNLLKPDKLLVWEELSQTTRHQTALRMITSIEETTMKISDSIFLQRNNTDSLLIEEENSNTEFIFTSSIGRQSAFGRSEDGEEDSTNSRNEFIIPRKAIGGLVNDESVLIFIEYSNMEDVLLNNKRIVEEETWRGEMNETLTIRGKKTVESESRKGKRVFNSKVIAAILSTNSVKQSALESDVFLIVERKDKSLVGNTECSFWNTTSTDKNKEGVWSNHGCFMMKEESNKTHVKCRCNHLTNFAILMDIHGVDKLISDADKLSLMIITRIGCSISMFFLFMSLIIFLKFRESFRDKVTNEICFMINVNLSICLLTSQFIFLTGITETSDKILCQVIGLFLLFFLLSGFVWMGLYGVLSIIMVVLVYDPKSGIKWKFLLTGYGVPFAICLDAVRGNFAQLRTENYCWLGNNQFIYYFIIPVSAVILLNMISSILICIKYQRLVEGDKHSSGSEKLERKKFYSMIQFMLKMLFTFGFIWVFGFLYISTKYIWSAYIFTILNTLQGLSVFVFLCLRSLIIQRASLRWLKQQHWLPEKYQQIFTDYLTQRLTSIGGTRNTTLKSEDEARPLANSESIITTGKDGLNNSENSNRSFGDGCYYINITENPENLVLKFDNEISSGTKT